MQTNGPEKEPSLNEKLADLILEAFPMPQADPKRRMPLVGLYMTDPAHPVVRLLYDQFKRDNGIPMSCAMSDKERLMFDLSLVNFQAKEMMFELCKRRISEKAEQETSE